MILDDYLAWNLSHDWSWGKVDCTLFPADWIRAATGRDPFAPWRGAYTDEFGARLTMWQAGGYVSACSREMEAAGFLRTVAPVEGDIGIVEAPVNRHRVGPVGAIFDGSFWLIRGTEGVFARRFPLVIAWQLSASA